MESEKKQELVIDGNSFYEIDLKCLKEKKQKLFCAEYGNFYGTLCHRAV